MQVRKDLGNKAVQPICKPCSCVLFWRFRKRKIQSQRRMKQFNTKKCYMLNLLVWMTKGNIHIPKLGSSSVNVSLNNTKFPHKVHALPVNATLSNSTFKQEGILLHNLLKDLQTLKLQLNQITTEDVTLLLSPGSLEAQIHS